LSPEAQEHHRTVGFLGPEELIPSPLLGLGKYYFENDHFDEALERLEQVVAGYGQSCSAPEAIFLSGVCNYKRSHDPKPLKAAYEKLNSAFPNSEWTKRAYPYRLL
jgi:TolA-binding protein